MAISCRQADRAPQRCGAFLLLKSENGVSDQSCSIAVSCHGLLTRSADGHSCWPKQIEPRSDAGFFIAKTCPTARKLFQLAVRLDRSLRNNFSGSVALRAKLTVGVGAASTADRARLRSRNQSETHIYPSYPKLPNYCTSACAFGPKLRHYGVCSTYLRGEPGCFAGTLP
jgi:hypothetical protein